MDSMNRIAQYEKIAVQKEVMPAASSENEGKIVQYVGDTNQYYTNAYFYKCVEDPENPGQYIWQEIPVSDNGAENISYDNTTSGMTATNVQDAIDEVFQSVSNKETVVDLQTSGLDGLTVQGYTESNEYTAPYSMDVCFYIKSSATKNGIYIKKGNDWYDYYTITPTANGFDTNIVLRFNEGETYKTKSNNTYDRVEVVAAFK